MPVASCPNCQSALNIPVANLGQPVRCGRCQEVFVAPVTGESQPTLPQPTLPTPPNDALRPHREPPSAQQRAQRRLDSFVSPQITGTAAWVAIGLTIAMCFLTIPASAYQVWLYYRLENGEPVADVEAELLLPLSFLPMLAQFLLYVLSAVLFLVWIYRAHANLTPLGAARLEYSPGWAVGSFFVPILNLFRPYQIVREIWKASQPAYLRPIEWQQAPVSSMLLTWWLLWIITNVVGNISGRIQFQAAEDDYFLLMIGSALNIPNDLVLFSCGVLIILIIRQIVWWQLAKYHRLVREGYPPPERESLPAALDEPGLTTAPGDLRHADHDSG